MAKRVGAMMDDRVNWLDLGLMPLADPQETARLVERQERVRAAMGAKALCSEDRWPRVKAAVEVRPAKETPGLRLARWNGAPVAR